MNKKKILILGSTGSIGNSTLNVLGNYKNKIEILCLSTNKNFRKLYKQSKLFNVKKLFLLHKRLEIKQLTSFETIK